MACSEQVGAAAAVSILRDVSYSELSFIASCLLSHYGKNSHLGWIFGCDFKIVIFVFKIVILYSNRNSECENYSEVFAYSKTCLEVSVNLMVDQQVIRTKFSFRVI